MVKQKELKVLQDFVEQKFNIGQRTWEFHNCRLWGETFVNLYCDINHLPSDVVLELISLSRVANIGLNLTLKPDL